MPKQGGQGKGKPKLGDRNFGKALIRRQLLGIKGDRKVTANTHSILDSTTLEDFIIHNEMEEAEIEVRRVSNNDSFLVDSSSNRNKIQSYTTKEFQFNHLFIPRKPSWNKEMTAEEVDRREKNAFLQWRRNIAVLEEEEINKTNHTLKVTPFEKNIEVWRQLWRVVERSDFLVQIVDARNPLLYYTEDLAAYAISKQKKMMLLVNKADLLTDYQRVCWSRYFKDAGIRCVFYSAKAEQAKLDESLETLTSRVDIQEMKALANFLARGWDDKSDLADSEENGFEKQQKEKIEECDEEEAEEEEVVWGPTNTEIENDEDGLEDLDEESEGEKVAREENAEINGSSFSALRDEEDEDERDDEVVEDAADNLNKPESEANCLVEVDGGEEEVDELSSEGESSESEGNQSDTELGVTSGTPIMTAQEDIVEEEEVVEELFSISERSRARVLNRDEIIVLLTTVTTALKISPQDRHNGRVCVGMVGYPNVGKSSVINTILGVSRASHGVVRVAVSATPGKTKHFQTLVVSDSLLLCDCPGLVFPSFMRSAGEMLCAGILPYNQIMRDYTEPAAVIAARVPMYLLEAAYGMKIQRLLDVMDDPDRPPTAHEMLCAYCAVKGYITNGTGRWDEFRACKDMLRDFTDGRILYVAPPPNMQSSSAQGPLQKWVAETEKTMLRSEKIADRVALQKLKQIECSASDAGEMVFGGRNSYRTIGDKSAASSRTLAPAGEFEYVVDSDSDDGNEKDGESISIGGGSSTLASTFQQPGLGDALNKREHKRLKHWGKKNKKLRDKNPYGEDNGVVSYIAYSTNRTGVFGGAHTVERDKIRRQDPRHAYGNTFVRAALPHQQPPLQPQALCVPQQTASRA